jgi:V8-like Glu-specific endopeptidase
LHPEPLGFNDSSVTLTLFDGYREGITSSSHDFEKDEGKRQTVSTDYVSEAGSCGSPVYRRCSSFVGIHTSTRKDLGKNQFIYFTPATCQWLKNH